MSNFIGVVGGANSGVAITGAMSGADAAAQLPTTASFLTLRHTVAPYLAYQVDTYYQFRAGNLQLPIAEDSPGVVGYTQSGTASQVYEQLDIQDPNDGAVVPVANYLDRPSSEIVQTSAPYGKKIVFIHAKRVGAMPVLPTPTPANANQTLDNVLIHECSSTIMPDMKTRIFTLTAQYIYILTKPLWSPDGNQFLPGTDADGNNRLQQYNIGTIQFVKGLI